MRGSLIKCHAKFIGFANDDATAVTGQEEQLREKKNSTLTQPSFTAHLELAVHGDGVKHATDAE